MMTKQPKLGLAEMKALLPPMPVLANESQEQFEKLFDQVARTLNVQDPVELIYIRDFVRPSWEIALYTRHRTVAFDRKLKGWVGDKLSHVRDRDVRRARRVNLGGISGPAPTRGRPFGRTRGQGAGGRRGDR
jgi:hypothetical protein